MSTKLCDAEGSEETGVKPFFVLSVLLLHAVISILKEKYHPFSDFEAIE